MKAATVTAPKIVATSPLWKWTGVSAAGHAIFLALLCLISHQIEKQKQAKLKAAAEEKTRVDAATEKAAADKIAADKKKAASPAGPGDSPKAAASNTTPGNTNDVKSAEKLLGIDKVASPDELKKGPKIKDDDLLKDLK